jgi:hypothetical protein
MQQDGELLPSDQDDLAACARGHLDHKRKREKILCSVCDEEYDYYPCDQCGHHTHSDCIDHYRAVVDIYGEDPFEPTLCVCGLPRAVTKSFIRLTREERDNAAGDGDDDAAGDDDAIEQRNAALLQDMIRIMRGSDVDEAAPDPANASYEEDDISWADD